MAPSHRPLPNQDTTTYSEPPWTRYPIPPRKTRGSIMAMISWHLRSPPFDPRARRLAETALAMRLAISIRPCTYVPTTLTTRISVSKSSYGSRSGVLAPRRHGDRRWIHPPPPPPHCLTLTTTTTGLAWASPQCCLSRNWP